MTKGAKDPNPLRRVDLSKLDPKKRADYRSAMNSVNGLLHEAAAEVPLDKERTIRLTAAGMSLLLGLAVEALGGDSDVADDPNQMKLFDERAGSPRVDKPDVQTERRQA